MKTIDGPSVKNTKKLIVAITCVLIFCITFGHTAYTYKSIKVIPMEAAHIEVGSSDIDLKELVKEVDGEIISIKQDVDTNVLGEQEAIFEVKKNNIIKEVPMTVSIVDSVAPVIELKEETITITQGEEYDLLTNIQNVVDSVDGELGFSEQANQSTLKTYNINLEGDMNSVGDHEVIVTAIDQSGNISSQRFTLAVVEPEPEPEPVYNNYSPVYYHLPANAASNDLVSIAYSYLGYPYGPGNYPGAFDCSGFVQFVYSQVGIGISRSTYTQIYDGYPVSYEEMQPGDIIIWGYGGQPTHSAMYVGDGLMIHSANYSTGVIVSDVGWWLNGSGTQILSIRRI